MKPLVGCVMLIAMGVATAASATTAAELEDALRARFKDDRTGACVVAAVVEPGKVLRGKTCARPRADGGPGYQSAFEIGSVTKTMTAFLVADLISQGKWSLEDPIGRHLPPGTPMPRPAERQILVRDLLTHSSGLPRMPPGFAPRDATDPYAELTEAELLTALGRVELGAAAPTYSNFGMMLVSLAVAHAYGSDYETALCERLFVPLKMGASYVSRPRGPVAAATGHLSSGAETPAWHVTTNLAGAGLVRASLEDMVKYAQAQLGLGDGALIARVRMTQKPLQAGYGMGWGRFKLQEHELAGHEGGTGGFSSLVLVDLTARRAVVILADTSLADLGGLRDLGNVLLGLRQPPVRPRTEATPSAELLAAMTGEYEASGISGRLWLDGKKLMAQLAGRPAFELHYDSRGDFYPKDFAGLLTPELHDGQVDRVTWRQGGSVIEAIRKGGSITPPAASTSPRGSASEPVQRL